MLAGPTDRCPCCGTFLAIAQETAWHRSLNLIESPYGSAILTATKGRIFDTVWRAKPEAVSLDQLVARVWPGADGGPDWPDNNIRVHCSRLRAKLAPLGIVLNHGFKGTSGYYLAITTPEHAAIAVKKIRERSGWR